MQADALRNVIDAQAGLEIAQVRDIGPDTHWEKLFDGCKAVVHLAARTHVMHDSAADPLAEYRCVNVVATQALALAAGKAGVRRLVFLSSIKVNGETTTGKPFSEQDAPHPEDEYGVSKWEAEQALWDSTAASRMEIVVLRPPLLYGPGVKGNFLSLMRAVDRGIPLPLASMHNRRNLLYIGNLADAIILCLDHPTAADKTYLLADDDGVSTPDLIRGIAHALGKPARLLPCPPAWLKFAGAAIGKSGAVSRLLESLQVDSSKIRRELGWQPRYDIAYGLQVTARWYHQRPDADLKN
jgi:nucleoside-diphosphate-sugar epimerase